MAIKFEKIQPGMALWDVKRNTGLARFRGKYSCWPVEVKEVDLEKRRVLILWNGNPERWSPECNVTKFRIKRPEER